MLSRLSVHDFKIYLPEILIKLMKIWNARNFFSVLAESELDVPSEFPFPFTPYDIQVEFMKNVYRTLEQGKIGILESPTGTVSILLIQNLKYFYHGGK